MVELNLGTNQIAKLPDDVACLQNLEVCLFFNGIMIFYHRIQGAEIKFASLLLHSYAVEGGKFYFLTL